MDDVDDFETVSRQIYRGLHSTLWGDAEGRVWKPEEMDPNHRLNAIDFMVKRAVHLEFYYSFGELLSLGPEPTAEAAGWAFEQIVNDLLEVDVPKRMDDPEAWIRSTPLIRALQQAQDDWESDSRTSPRRGRFSFGAYAR